MKTIKTPNFNHRIVTLFGDKRDMNDTINIMSDRALGVLNLIATQFEDKDANTVCNETIYLALHAAINEIEDIKAYLQANQ